MKKLHTLAFAALFAAAPLWAQTPSAQTPSDESVKRLMELSQTEKMIVAGMNQSMASEKQQIDRFLDSKPQLSPQQRQQIKQAVARYTDQFTAAAQTPETLSEITAALHHVVQKHFTQEEVDFQIRYLNDPLAQQILDKQPAYLADIAAAAEKLSEKLLEQPKMMKYKQELESEIEKITTTPKKTKKKKR